jgi:hypothetical protein
MVGTGGHHLVLDSLSHLFRQNRLSVLHNELRMRVVVRPPECREVSAEVQVEIAPKTVTDTAELGSAHLRSGPGQGWEEHVVAQLKFGSCRRPEPIDSGFGKQLSEDCF